jgi:DNA mismatch repair ATPase MutS
MILAHYEQLEKHYFNQQTELNKKINSIAFLRLLCIVALIASIYFYYNSQDISFIVLALISIVAFLRLLVLHLKNKQEAQLFGLLKTINTNEIAYLKGDLTPFATGKAFIQTDHPFTHDLDIFGENSIFSHINRTTTPLGEEKLAIWLRNSEKIDILQQQEAVKELALKLDWRQRYLASGQLFVDEKTALNAFEYWLNLPLNYANKTILKALSFILPTLTVIALIMNFVSDNELYYTAFKVLFFLNIGIVALHKKRITEEHQLLTDRDNALKKYSALLQSIENEAFTSVKLQALKARAASDNVEASVAIAKLARLLNAFDTILNPVAAFLMNGLFQYHLHALFNLEKWKTNYGANVMQWFLMIGEFEALSSIANFAYNHPDFTMPVISTHAELIGKNMGHPLIDFNKRINNDIEFRDTKFVVLTGSNMSGKSTFLRTLGVNLILTKIGSPVCAERFTVYPFNLFVSMRVNDSLQNDESFFFAELKRLQRIINELDKPERTFIILDEILRGTNSNDKRAGTQGLIKNLISKNAIGIIATHDLVISEMQKEYPNYLANNCFEAEITDNELRFDYKLRSGVCQQMSAAFLMHKMGIINTPSV